ncbi:type III secretion system effector VopA, acetyltransferase [Xenorhabdus beddingii]|uniref:Type III secretion system effector VopA, acetyltransferase n=1 Tax=Xenorhabdus beddingii TaxID=40578 RepID=A0A1Y2SSB5_9GAMM|nr:YopJ family acetyltransferase [Xenorhabdus beddingii]OTA20661.1 type III secretion system effector VopA, acetyltransferase [Xenorhabdus beddingii]
MYSEEELYKTSSDCFTRNQFDVISKLRSYLAIINYNIKENKQINPDFAVIADKILLPKIIELENIKRPGLNLFYAETPIALARKLTELVQKNETSARFIVGSGVESRYHFIALDYRKLGGKPSLIGIESAIINEGNEHNVPRMLIENMKLAFKLNNIDIPFVVIPSDVQKSMGECLIFSIFFCKRMFKDSIHIEKLHQNNTLMSDTFIQRGFTSSNAANAVLPPTFMKHVQARSRLDNFLSRWKESHDFIVNKKNQTLAKRFEQHKITGENQKVYSNSIEIKRKNMIESILESYNKREDFFDKK